MFTYKTISIIIFCAFLSGCISKSLLKDYSTTAPQPPTNDREVIISKALRHALIDEKDIPDYSLIKNKEKIAIRKQVDPSEDSMMNFELSSHYIPKSNDVSFVLLSKEELQCIANDYGEFVYVYISKIEINNSKASVELGTGWVTPDNYKGIIMSGGWYKQIYTKENGNWKLEKTTDVWIS